MTKLTREQFGVASGDSIIVRGTITFAKLDKPVDGKALERLNQRRVNKGMKETKPFRRITIKNPSFVQGEGSPLAKFHEQNMYENSMTLESKSLFPPSYKHLQHGEFVVIEDPQKNPVIGQEIMIQISAFQSKGFPYLGSGLDVIIFPEGAIEFYEPSRAEDNLSGFGKPFDVPVPVESSPVKIRGFADAPIISPEKIGVDISNSPFSGQISDKFVSGPDITHSDVTNVPPLSILTDFSTKILNENKAAAETETINIDSPFGPIHSVENTEKKGINNTRNLSRFA